MKKILVLVLLSISWIAHATTYYVSTSGSNSNNGLTTSTPWQTPQWAADHATSPGDIIALKRGDTWSLSTTVVIKHGGVAGNPIIWDGDLWGTGAKAKILVTGNRPDGNIAGVHFITSGAAYVTFKNVTVDGNNKYCWGIVIGYHQAISNNAQNNEHDIVIDGCDILNIGNGSAYCQGFLCSTWYNDIWNITIKNCYLDGCDDEQLTFYGGRSDEWDAVPAECRNVLVQNNYMTNWGRRGQSTGYGMQLNNKLTGAIVENNTLVQGPSGKGNGIQIESNEPQKGFFPTGIVLRYNNVTVTRENEWSFYVQGGQAMKADVYYNIFKQGTSSTASDGGCAWITNTGSYSGAAFNFWNNIFYSASGRTFQNDCATTGVTSLKNNIIYNARTGGSGLGLIINSSGSTNHSNNLLFTPGTGDNLLIRDGSRYIYKSGLPSWESTAKSDDPQFKSLSAQDFHLLTGSPAIGSGISIPGLTRDITGAPVNNPPNIGSYESSGGTITVAYTGSSIANATPSLLELTFSQTLAAIVPAASAFAVKVNSVASSVNSVTVAGTKVQLTLASPVVYGDAVTVAYTKPSTNPLQTTSGSQVATLSAQNVTNNVSAVVPVYVSSAVANATPAILEMTYNLTLANIVPAASAFAVKVNSVARSVSSVTVAGTRVQLTLASPVSYGDAVTVAYTKPSASPLQTTSGGQAVTLSAQTVTNNVSAALPVYVNSAVANTTPTILEMTYNQTLANILPATSSFAVKVNSVVRSVNSVTIAGAKVQLTLASPVAYGDVVTVAYTKPSTNPLQTTAGSQAATISAQTVTNNVGAVVPVYVSSVVANTTPTILEMTYNLTLANIIPATSSFAVKVNSVVRSVNAVTIAGTKVQLTLSSPVVNGDVVTVAYTKPSTNPLQTSSGSQAASFSAQTVTNNINVVAPLNISMTISPRQIHKVINISFDYSTPVTSPSTTRQQVRIFDYYGRLRNEYPMDAGIANISFPINLRRGVYTVNLYSNESKMASKRIMVY